MSVICIDEQFRNLMSAFKLAAEDGNRQEDQIDIASNILNTLAAQANLSNGMKTELEGSIFKQISSLIPLAAEEGIEGGPATDLIFDIAPYVPEQERPDYITFELNSFEQYLNFRIASSISSGNTLQNYQAILLRQNNRKLPVNASPHIAPPQPR